MTLFPTRRFDALTLERYNRQTEQEYIDIRDFLVLHYNATARDDSDFWNYCRTLEPPEGLAYKLDMFQRSGRIFREHEELFTETSWLAVMMGQGIEPQGYHPAADVLPDDETLARLAHIRGVIAETCSLMPMQRDYLRQNGAASGEMLRADITA